MEGYLVKRKKLVIKLRQEFNVSLSMTLRNRHKQRDIYLLITTKTQCSLNIGYFNLKYPTCFESTSRTLHTDCLC
jgi:hypothetical protein